MANRLSASGRFKVLLIEAGPKWVIIPSAKNIESLMNHPAMKIIPTFQYPSSQYPLPPTPKSSGTQ